MRFLIDAHLPASLCALLSCCGHDALHTIDLPDKNKTKDGILNQISLADHRVLISKDTDFFYSHVLQGRPWKLLLVGTGNISTRDLKALFERNISAIEAALQSHTLVEIDRAAVTPVLKGK
jgi:predicted nuclease of predicted toxin-antitoxin system